jgi:arabinofuranosyltransferase
MALTMLLLVFALIVLRHGWVVDDAYITLRTVDNLFEGHGLVWNVGERVQAYTHPLWMLLVCCVYAITDEFFYSLIVFGTLMSTLALALVSVRLARSEHVGAALVVLATLSHAFIEYSTAGLENPLSHLLFASAAWVYFGRLPSARRFGLLFLIGGLAMLARPDNAVLLAPVVVTAGFQAWRRGCKLGALARAAALAAIPWVCWELFSLFYYGLLIPNTALAKLNTSIPKGELFEQGLFYLVATLDADPLTLLLILAGIAVPIVTRDRKTLPFALGIFLHLLYIVSIGGDFMLGRFLTAPMFVSLIVLSQLRGIGRARLAALTVALAAVGLATSPSTLAINGTTSPDHRAARTDRRVTDERAFFFEDASLLSAHRIREMPDHPWRWIGERDATSGKRTATTIAMGYRGLAAGPDVYLIDRAALTDPLLAWLPARYEPYWMTGHFLRAVPSGYVETRETGKNALTDRKLAELYDRVQLVVSGPLWSRERLAAIWWLNTGGPAELIDKQKYRFEGAVQLQPETLSKPVPEGTKLSSKRLRRLPAQGAHIKFAERQHPRTVQLSLNYEDHFELRFYDGGEELARVPVPRAPKRALDGMTTRTVELPAELQAGGFTRLRVLPTTRARNKKPIYAIGHLLFDAEPPPPPPPPK